MFQNHWKRHSKQHVKKFKSIMNNMAYSRATTTDEFGMYATQSKFNISLVLVTWHQTIKVSITFYTEWLTYIIPWIICVFSILEFLILVRMSICMKIIDSCDKYYRNKRAYCHQGKRICKCFLDRRV